MRPSEIFDLIKAEFPEVRAEEGTDAVVCPKEDLLKLCRWLKNGSLGFDDLHCVTAIDRKERIDLVHIFYSTSQKHILTLKIYLDAKDPSVESLAPIWRSADWFERETYDLFGITFLHHPDPRRILNPYDWKDYPLRKDYANPNFIPKPRL
jgi:NADH:ubiquinone oxidoreductase subunit C